MTERGTTDRVTLRFNDDEMERAYRREAGRESLAGFRLIAAMDSTNRTALVEDGRPA